MAENTKIEWADHTFNPWRGCTKISDACDFCYAETLVTNRLKENAWGNNPRIVAADSTWKIPVRWNNQADKFEAENGRPQFVFTASLADIFDNQVDPEVRERFWNLVRKCNRLIWLILTKRPQNIAKMLPPDWGNGWPHVWLGTTVEHQAAAERNVPALMDTRAARRFLSCEPLLGPIDLTNLGPGRDWHNVMNGRSQIYDPDYPGQPDEYAMVNVYGGPRIDWVIAGGESGPNARPSHPDWFRSLRDQCAAADVSFLFKQWGEWIDWDHAIDLDGLDVLKAPTRGDGGETSIQYLRAGKAKAGRLLDGVTHDGRPAGQMFSQEF